MRALSKNSRGAFRIGLLLILMLLCGLAGLAIGLLNAPAERPVPHPAVEEPRKIPPPKPTPIPEPPHAPPAAPEKFKEQTWEEATDAIKLIQIYKDAVMGSWRVENGELLCKRSDAATITRSAITTVS